MHLAYLDQERSPLDRRTMLRGGALGAGLLLAGGMNTAASAEAALACGAGTRSLTRLIHQGVPEGLAGVA